jgi:hypothetical protein
VIVRLVVAKKLKVSQSNISQLEQSTLIDLGPKQLADQIDWPQASPSTADLPA